MRTLDVLDDVGLLHVGSYRNAEEKENNLVVGQGCANWIPGVYL